MGKLLALLSRNDMKNMPALGCALVVLFVAFFLVKHFEFETVKESLCLGPCLVGAVWDFRP